MPYPLTVNDTFIEINVGGRVARIDYADLPGNTPAQLANALKLLLQAEIDTRIPLADLPDDEPTKTVNPDAPNFFWGDGNGVVRPNPNQNDHLIARDTVVTLVEWDVTRSRYIIEQRTVRGVNS